MLDLGSGTIPIVRMFRGNRGSIVHRGKNQPGGHIGAPITGSGKSHHRHAQIGPQFLPNGLSQEPDRFRPHTFFLN